MRTRTGKGTGEGRRPSRGPERAAAVPLAARSAALVLSFLLLALAPSCGYRLQGRAGSSFTDPGIRVDMRPFANESVIPDAGAYLASRLREEMRRNGFRGKFERSRADYIVEGTVGAIREEVFSRGEDGFALEYRMTVSVGIRVVEVTRGTLLWKEDGLSDAASFYSGTDFQYTESNRRIAFQEVAKRIARRIGYTLKEVL